MADSYDNLLRELELQKRLLGMNARDSFASFMPYVNPIYKRMWFHKVIADYCQNLLEGSIRRLMVFVPPQHGKSEIISRCFPAWALGRNPDLKIVGCSYSSDLSQQFSRNIQHIIDSREYHDIFPDTILNNSEFAPSARGYVRNMDFFEVIGHRGFYKSVGVGGSLTGTPADIGIIDDPVKDASEAYSETFRNRAWEWYNAVFLTRLHNDSRQLVIMTRWHDDDLAGRILRHEPEEWVVLRIPALRETMDDGNGFDPRQVGEALWEERHSRQRLLEAQRRSARIFSALYQQSPAVDGGNIIRRDWFRYVSRSEFEQRRRGQPIVFFLDTAYTDKTSNDPSGIIGTCMIGRMLYVTCAQKVNYKFPRLIRFLPDYVRMNGYGPGSTLRIEPKANGLSVIDQLNYQTNLNVVATPSPKESKETRLNTNSPYVESGRVCLVEDTDWNGIFVEEVCGFPSKPHDEFVDLLCYACGYHFGHEGEMTDEEIERVFLL